MRTLLPRVGLCLVLVAAFAGMHALSTSADNGKPAYTPIANVKTIMNALNSEEGGFFGMLVEDCKNPNLPREHWTLMRHRAAMLEEAGNILAQLDPPKGEAASWRKHSANFSAAAKALKKPLIRKKADLVKAALDGVKKQCDACHKDHRPE